jgi:predicted outer membrane protein
MYPNQPTPPQAPLPTDYLNQIAPQAPKKQIFQFGLKQVIIIGAALVILVIILASVVGAITGGKKDPIEHLAARLAATSTVATDAQANLKSSQLRSVNSNLKLYMTNTNRDIATPLLAAGVNTAKLSKSITTSESTAALSARLEDARLNAVFDATYAREMAYQLGTTLTLMQQIYQGSGNTSLRTFIKSAYDNLLPIQVSFANYSSTTD